MTHVNIKLVQHASTATKKLFDGHANWIVVFPHPLQDAASKKFPYASVLIDRRKRSGNKNADTQPIVTDLPNRIGTRIAFACIKQDTEAFNLLTLARKLIATHLQHKVSTINVAISGFTTEATERIAEAIVSAACSAAANMPTYKNKNGKKPALQKLVLHGIKTSHTFKRSIAEAEGNAVARYLSMLPPNKLTPSDYLKHVKSLAREYGWKLKFMDEKALKRKNAGAFLAVAQGSPTRDAGIVYLQYQPDTAGRKEKLALVGKGICYDTGGASLKPPKFMFGMHEDMQGSAVALGTLIALSKLKVPFTVECWLALAMNHIGPRAYVPNDVITASDGTTIEVVNTDAEGRMILADTLAMASNSKPTLLIDYATLTGACVYSLGTAYSGVFTNQPDYLTTLIETGKDSGERVWPFPMDADYDKGLASKIADVKQCSMEGGADHILAARFLQRFVKEKTPWIHMDLSSSNRKGGLAHIATDTTGFGVRYTVNLLLDKTNTKISHSMNKIK